MNSWLRTLLYIAAVVLITACISVAATITIMNSQRGERVVLDNEEYQQYHALLPLLELMEKIKEEHHGGEVSDENLIEGALKGMLETMGDPYARYYTEEEFLAYMEEMGGAYHGIGVVVGQPREEGKEWGAPVLKVYAKSPAEEAGLLAGDLIVSVDGEALTGMQYEEIEQMLASGEQSSLQLSLQRGGQTMPLEVARAGGVLQRVTHKLFLQRTGYIRIDQFTGTAAEEFSEAIRDLTDRGMRSLVVDLRSNPGGELEQVVAMSNMLLKDALIVTVRYANGETQEYFADKRAVEVPLAVLVNENSASASELLAAAVQENGRGLVVGGATYGKGVVQRTMQLRSNYGWVKMTTAAYYTPLGNSLEGKGIQPDIDVDLADEMKALPIEEIEQEDDAQLWAALDVIREQADEQEAANAPALEDEEEQEAA